jgi:short-subunit dehydrogenase
VPPSVNGIDCGGCAQQLGKAGINLILIARQKNLLQELAREVSGESPVQVRVLPLDLTRPDWRKRSGCSAACPADRRQKR